MRIAIAQIRMAWTTEENQQSILAALDIAADYNATVCVFPELAITGFHRQIKRESVSAMVEPALAQVRARCAKRLIAAALGVPRFRDDGSIANAIEFIGCDGQTIDYVEKIGLTPAEATFFDAGASRPVITIDGKRCSAIICREVQDIEILKTVFTPDSLDLLFWPGIMRPDPTRAGRCEPHIEQARSLATHTRTWMIQSNWPNSLNYPEEGIEQGQSAVISPGGELVFRLPKAVSGVGVFSLGEATYQWIEM